MALTATGMQGRRLNKLSVHVYVFWIWYAMLFTKGAELARLVRRMTLNQEVPGSYLDTAIWEKTACAVGQGTLPKVVMDNDHLLSLDYEYGNGKILYCLIKKRKKRNGLWKSLLHFNINTLKNLKGKLFLNSAKTPPSTSDKRIWLYKSFISSY